MEVNLHALLFRQYVELSGQVHATAVVSSRVAQWGLVFSDKVAEAESWPVTSFGAEVKIAWSYDFASVRLLIVGFEETVGHFEDYLCYNCRVQC
jgi:hypothetical protein